MRRERVTGQQGRRADAGSIRLGERDIAGLLLCGEIYGIPYDLLASALGVSADWGYRSPACATAAPAVMQDLTTDHLALPHRRQRP